MGVMGATWGRYPCQYIACNSHDHIFSAYDKDQGSNQLSKPEDEIYQRVSKEALCDHVQPEVGEALHTGSSVRD